MAWTREQHQQARASARAGEEALRITQDFDRLRRELRTLRARGGLAESRRIERERTAAARKHTHDTPA